MAPQLSNLDINQVIAAAGGDPWAVDASVQRGRPSKISDLALAFHNAGRCTSESSKAFAEARNRFEASWNRENGDHPINDSAEVQRATQSLGVQADKLPKIGTDLETIAEHWRWLARRNGRWRRGWKCHRPGGGFHRGDTRGRRRRVARREGWWLRWRAIGQMTQQPFWLHPGTPH